MQLASAVLEAVENNTLSIEPVGLQPVRFVKASAVECGGPKYVELTDRGGNLDSLALGLRKLLSAHHFSPICMFSRLFPKV